jgi:predicted Zn-dependent protease
MKQLKPLILAALLATSTAYADSTSINLGAIFDTAKKLMDSQSVGNMSDPEEIAIGRNVAASTLGAYPLIRDEALQRNINRIGVWIALQSPRPDLPWRFAAVESPAVNAFAAPGGIIMVTRGMLNNIANEAELACILGHEIGHVSRRHHLSVLQKSMLAEAGTSALNVSSKTAGGAQAGKQLLNEGRTLFTHALDRSAEREADEDGVLLAAKAGYDPGACLSFMQRLASGKQESSAMQELYKTHPPAQERVSNVDGALRKLKGAEAGEGARPEFAALQSGNKTKRK